MKKKKKGKFLSLLSLHFSGGRESNKNMSEVIGTDRSDERRKKAKKKNPSARRVGGYGGRS